MNKYIKYVFVSYIYIHTYISDLSMYLLRRYQEGKVQKDLHSHNVGVRREERPDALIDDSAYWWK